MKHLAEHLVSGKDSIDAAKDAGSDDGDHDDGDGDSESCKGSSHSLDTHYGPPLCVSVYFR